MNKENFNNHPLSGLLTPHREVMETLKELALDLRWSWNHAADELWRQLDPELWEITHNPWVMLQTVSRDRLEKQLADEAFSGRMWELVKLKDQLNNSPAWFRQNHPDTALSCVAYFSMESVSYTHTHLRAHETDSYLVCRLLLEKK